MEQPFLVHNFFSFASPSRLEPCTDTAFSWSFRISHQCRWSRKCQKSHFFGGVDYQRSGLSGLSIFPFHTSLIPQTVIFFHKEKNLRWKLKKLSFIPMKFRWPSGKEPSLRDEFCLSNHVGAFSKPISNVEKPLEKRKQSLDKNWKQQSTITCTDITWSALHEF